MKPAFVLAALGAFCGAASAHAGHNHEMLHKMMAKARDVSPSHTTNNATCGCVTSVSTWYGEATLVQPTTTSPRTTTQTSTSYSTITLHETTMTITATNSVYVCPFTSAAAPTSEASAPAAHSEAHTPAPAPQSPAPAPPSYSAPASSKSPSPSPSGNAGSAPISGNGNQWAITYSPYTAAGACKEAGAVSVDISSIKSAGFTTVRLYSTDCSGLHNVGNACKEYGLKLVLGVFIDNKGIDAARPQVTDIISWGQWQIVELIVIGNEALFNHYCDAGALAGFIADSKAQFQAAGYGGPCTTTETLNIWQQSGSSLCGVVDVIGANVHPFFNAEVSPDQAGPFTAGQIEILGKVCPGKEVYNLESGWPHSGQANGKATPGVEAQSTAIKSIMENVGAKTVFFSFEDDLWKQPGQFGVEQSWGCNKVFSA
ncbi:hypothetical protein GJ744_004642 [Endocarpon pusillum]|uniref:Probable beta-glucosidase btgE n=1 Tax=Endocarpon pusillum TaxID=364733 RepID=A0A8H7E7V4_9EURO|nr:hypothetical protein GJ744_004642 [Endocarpon pusillum]